MPDAELTREHRVECQVCKKAFKISREDALLEMQKAREVRVGR